MRVIGALVVSATLVTGTSSPVSGPTRDPSRVVSDCLYALTGPGTEYWLTPVAGPAVRLERLADDDATPVRTVSLAGGVTVRIKFLRGMLLDEVWATVERNSGELEELAKASLNGEDEPSEPQPIASALGTLETFAAKIDDGSGQSDFLILSGRGSIVYEAGRQGRNCLRASSSATVRGASSVGDDVNVFVFP